ncbi:MAG TPA: hypothetical protein VF017_06890 [Thermoanaerobaculia bacterium]|nr:hypothetical protein [Thermoanaerobaculia bacterium]
MCHTPDSPHRSARSEVPATSVRLILELDAKAAGIRRADLEARFGPNFSLDAPTPEYPPDYPAYTIYSCPWGDLRLGLGLGRASGLLETVVIDAER